MSKKFPVISLDSPGFPRFLSGNSKFPDFSQFLGIAGGRPPRHTKIEAFFFSRLTSDAAEHSGHNMCICHSFSNHVEIRGKSFKLLYLFNFLLRIPQISTIAKTSLRQPCRTYPVLVCFVC